MPLRQLPPGLRNRFIIYICGGQKGVGQLLVNPLVKTLYGEIDQRWSFWQWAVNHCPTLDGNCPKIGHFMVNPLVNFQFVGQFIILVKIWIFWSIHWSIHWSILHFCWSILVNSMNYYWSILVNLTKGIGQSIITPITKTTKRSDSMYIIKHWFYK